MTKIRLLKGNLEKKSVQNTLKKRGVRAAIAGALVGSMSVTMMGCKPKEEAEVATDTKPAVEEKVEDEEKTVEKTKEKKETEEKKKIEEKAETVENKVTRSLPVQNNAGKGNYIATKRVAELPSTGDSKSKDVPTIGKVTVDKPAPVVTKPTENKEVKPVKENTPAEETKTNVEPSEETKTDVKPVEETKIEVAVEPTEYSENGYIKNITQNHLDNTVIKLYENAMKDGYYPETIEVDSDEKLVELGTVEIPAHEFNGAKFEWNEIKSLIPEGINTVKIVASAKEIKSSVAIPGTLMRTVNFAPAENGTPVIEIKIYVHESRYDLNKDGYEDNRYISEDAIPEGHLQLIEKRLTEALIKKGFTVNSDLYAGDYSETLSVPLHEYNGLKDIEINTIVEILNKAKSKEFDIYVSRRGDVNKDSTWVTVSFAPDLTDANGDGYADALMYDKAYNNTELSSLDFVYSEQLFARGLLTVEYKEDAKKIAEFKFPAHYSNGKNSNEVDVIMSIINESEAENVSIKVANSENLTITVSVYGDAKKEVEIPVETENETPVETEKEDKETSTSIETEKEETPVETEKEEVVVENPVEIEKEEETPTPVVEKEETPNTAPTLTVIDEVNLSIGQELTDVMLNIVASDKEDGNNVSIEIDKSSVDINTPGSYGVTVVARDSNGLYAEKTVIVNITGSTQELTQDEAYADALNKEILKLVNEERAKVGVEPLAWSDQIETYSTAKSLDMIKNNYFDHIDLKGRYTYHDMGDDGITFRNWGENIITGYKKDVASTARNLVDRWMASQGHKENILAAKYTETGIGVFVVGNTVYGTQIFLNR